MGEFRFIFIFDLNITQSGFHIRVHLVKMFGVTKEILRMQEETPVGSFRPGKLDIFRQFTGMGKSLIAARIFTTHHHHIRSAGQSF
jgi:hypothetical protein